jgi:hypothetical protein
VRWPQAFARAGWLRQRGVAATLRMEDQRMHERLQELLLLPLVLCIQLLLRIQHVLLLQQRVSRSR